VLLLVLAVLGLLQAQLWHGETMEQIQQYQQQSLP
jgi:hypothetical protein